MASSGSPVHGGDSSIFSKLSSAFNNAYRKLVGSFESQIRSGRSAMDMPVYLIAPLSKKVVGSNTGPYGGLCQLEPTLDHPTHDRESTIAGISDWYRPHPVADGDSITLYEHKPGNTQHHGDPIADVFSVVVRPNNSIIAVADGVNWGIKPRLAARCAVHGVMDHLNHHLYNRASAPKTVQDVFHAILRSFHSGQKMIIKSGGTTTTLCVAVVVELQEPRGLGGTKWGLCVVSVGDTLCYVWRGDEQMVYEVTSAMHQGKERNPRDCGGCLGCDLGDQPDLSNLLCCFVPVREDDVVFVVSDGVSDNSDPVILKEAVAEGQPLSPTSETPMPIGTGDGGGGLNGKPGHNGSTLPRSTLPLVTPEQRQALILMKLSTILKSKWKALKRPLYAQDVRDSIVNYVIEATEEKRGYLEKCWVEMEKPDITVSERRANERKIGQHIKSMPGKLDHATVAAYKVGKISDTLSGESWHSPTHYHRGRIHTATAAATSSGGSIFYSDTFSSNPKGPARRKRVKLRNSRHVLGTAMKKSASMEDGLSSSRQREANPFAKAATVDLGGYEGEGVEIKVEGVAAGVSPVRRKNKEDCSLCPEDAGDCMLTASS